MEGCFRAQRTNTEHIGCNVSGTIQLTEIFSAVAEGLTGISKKKMPLTSL
jgi:hypothetical protein